MVTLPSEENKIIKKKKSQCFSHSIVPLEVFTFLNMTRNFGRIFLTYSLHYNILIPNDNVDFANFETASK